MKYYPVQVFWNNQPIKTSIAANSMEDAMGELKARYPKPKYSAHCVFNPDHLSK